LILKVENGLRTPKIVCCSNFLKNLEEKVKSVSRIRVKIAKVFVIEMELLFSVEFVAIVSATFYEVSISVVFNADNALRSSSWTLVSQLSSKGNAVKVISFKWSPNN